MEHCPECPVGVVVRIEEDILARPPQGGRFADSPRASGPPPNLQAGGRRFDPGWLHALAVCVLAMTAHVRVRSGIRVRIARPLSPAAAPTQS